MPGWPGGESAEPFFQRGGAKQAARDAGEDLREIAGVEDDREEGEAGEDLRVSGVLAQRLREALAVGDERVDEAEDLADASGLGPIWIGVVGFDQATAGPDMNTIRTQMPGTWQELFLGSREFSGDAGAGWLPVPEAGGGGVF